ncbi:carboxyvinyl-carboxyphosphonate phosphorylmutase [Microbulbifer sp. A4B17]|uniref:isocitrate lyase/PEP mutase family protein n=1 Tax=Microbulbifer sp. A4B17 TaxID=359370 RepID=UPI000D52D4EE|nr:oxaloacetate decarboxylase [Microbulbifer sp. A4B17]AWF82865.1 carboxyvinyl-carboxyphosphonate phosphorylmutase [Microbulbifer sp. A4B17]
MKRMTTTLRAMINEPGLIVAPGAYDCLTAKIIQEEGFKALYMTGGGTAVTHVGRPDLGFITLSEMAANARAIASTVNIPVIADADTGFGGALNAYRTVQEYERSGVAGLHIEDQILPKQCGHLAGKQVVPIPEMVHKIYGALEGRTDDDFVIIARTDALAVTGVDDTLKRCVAYAEAGVDALFVEAITSREEILRVQKEVDIPLMYNFGEHGKSPLFTHKELEELSYKLVIYPGSLMFSMCKLAQRVLRELKAKGTTEDLISDMYSPKEFYETMDSQHFQDLDNKWKEEADKIFGGKKKG